MLLFLIFRGLISKQRQKKEEENVMVPPNAPKLWSRKAPTDEEMRILSPRTSRRPRHNGGVRSSIRPTDPPLPPQRCFSFRNSINLTLFNQITLLIIISHIPQPQHSTTNEDRIQANHKCHLESLTQAKFSPGTKSATRQKSS